jgi:glucose/arabinose dehydrogenase
MTVPYRGFTVALLTATVMAVAAACSGSAGQGPGPAAPSSRASAASAASSGSPAASAPTVQVPAGRSSTPLAVPAGEGGGALAAPHTLTVPAGWTARLWARVPGARMEAWTPEGDLLVSDPADGKIMELRPDAAGTAVTKTLLAGLTNPQGLAFARLEGKWVLYVAESDQIDRYPWAAAGISGVRTVIAARLPDLDPAGDDVHRAKDVTVAADGTVYFNVGSSSNASPGDRTMAPQRAVIMAVRPGGTALRVVERGVRNGEGLAAAPDGTVWTAVNERDNIPYPSQGPYGTYRDPFGQVIQGYGRGARPGRRPVRQRRHRRRDLPLGPRGLARPGQTSALYRPESHSRSVSSLVRASCSRVKSASVLVRTSV